jgi:hypothetical protein
MKHNNAWSGRAENGSPARSYHKCLEDEYCYFHSERLLLSQRCYHSSLSPNCEDTRGIRRQSFPCDRLEAGSRMEETVLVSTHFRPRNFIVLDIRRLLNSAERDRATKLRRCTPLSCATRVTPCSLQLCEPAHHCLLPAWSIRKS